MAHRLPDAAGLVVWRPVATGGIEVLIVHRRRRGDWTLPKGRIDPGEGAYAAARREVVEETGFTAHVSRFLGRMRYCGRDGGCGREAFVWSARATGGAFRANTEIDRVAWLPPEQAAARLQRREARFLRGRAAAVPGRGLG